LIPEQAQALVEVSRQALASAADHLRAHDALRTRLWLDQTYPAEVSLAILDCVATQAHFATKFENASDWLLSRLAAEQATASLLARWRSDYLRSRFPNIERLTELGTGLGGDSVFLARNFELRGYESDAARCTLALKNVAQLSPAASSFEIENKQVKVSELRGELLFADPARRGQSRKFHPESWNPPLSSLLLAANRFDGTVLKTAPGLKLELVPEDMEIHFLSLEGELKEAMLLRPAAVKSGPKRHAWLWEPESESPLHRQGEAVSVEVREPSAGDFLHNPDPAVVRSGLLNGLAGELGAGVVHPRIGYLCGPTRSPNGWATSFAILESLPLQWKRLNAALMATDWSEIEYLSRGVPFSQEEVLQRTRAVRKSMKSRTGGRGALVIYRENSGYRAVLARRVSGQGKLVGGGTGQP
jgi:hypothetical protein